MTDVFYAVVEDDKMKLLLSTQEEAEKALSKMKVISVLKKMDIKEEAFFKLLGEAEGKIVKKRLVDL